MTIWCYEEHSYCTLSYQPYALECCPVEPLAQLEWKAHGTTGFVDIKLEYTLHKAAAGDSPGRYRITKRQITIAKDWKSDPGRTPWSAESHKCLTVDDGRQLSHDLRSVTMTSGKRPAQHCQVCNNASTHHFKLVTHLSPLGVPQVRFVPPAQSAQNTDSKHSMHIASHVYYHSSRKKSYWSPKISWIRRVQEDVDSHIRPHVDSFDFFGTTNLSRFP